jgi:predicted anti-sigma-YlaC factor YlaD
MTMTPSDFDGLIAMHETKGLNTTMKHHLKNCPDCRNSFNRYIALTTAMTMTGMELCDEFPTDIPRKKLSPMLKKMIANRKKKWQQEQLA